MGGAGAAVPRQVRLSEYGAGGRLLRRRGGPLRNQPTALIPLPKTTQLGQGGRGTFCWDLGSLLLDAAVISAEASAVLSEDSSSLSIVSFDVDTICFFLPGVGEPEVAPTSDRPVGVAAR